MSKRKGAHSVVTILEKPDAFFLANWTSLASLIKNHEDVEWDFARQLAIQLLKGCEAQDYVSQVRLELGGNKAAKPKVKKKETKKQKSSPKHTPKRKSSKTIAVAKTASKPSSFELLMMLAPDIFEYIDNNESFIGKSRLSGYKDLELSLIGKDKSGYILALSQYSVLNGEQVPDPRFELLLNVDQLTLEALAFENSSYRREVYSDMYDRTLQNPVEHKNQNAYLRHWLDDLVRQGHCIECTPDQREQAKKTTSFSELEDATQSIFDAIQAPFLADATQIEPIAEPTELQQENYLKLFFLCNDAVTSDEPLSKDDFFELGSYVFLFKGSSDVERFDYVIRSQKDLSEVFRFTIDQTNESVFVRSVNEQSTDQSDMDVYFSKWLDSIKKKETTRLESEQPIILEWQQKESDFYLEFSSLESVQSELLARLSEVKNDTYKLIIHFENSSLSIELIGGKQRNNFSPELHDLEDWLYERDPSVEWFEYSSNHNRYDLQKRADQIPQFELGSVELTREHRRAGLTQKAIDWINEHQQGLIITPNRKSTNPQKGKSGVMKTIHGKRISRLGRIFYFTQTQLADQNEQR